MVEPASPAGQRSELGPGGNSVALLTLFPVNSPIRPTTPGLALHVSNRYDPVTGTVHSYHTDAPPRLSWMVCSPGSTVAPTLIPVTDPEVPLSTCALPKLSLAGGLPEGACGVTRAVGCEGWLVPPSALVAVTVQVYLV